MPKIPIITAQKVNIEYDTASWMERAVAFAIDLLILVITGLLLYSLNVLQSGSIGDIIYYLIFGLIISTYTLWCEFFFNGLTIGKKVMKIRVMRLDGEPPVFGDYFGRWVFRLIDIYGSFGMLASFLVGSSNKAQRVGDMISNTVVIKDRLSLNLSLKEILGLATTESYQPVYGNVTKLTEDEMLIIKEAVDRKTIYANTAHEEAMKLLFEKVIAILEIKKIPVDRNIFFKTLIKDYIVLTR